MAQLHHCIRCVNSQIHTLLPAEGILRFCVEAGHRFRRRKLGPAETILLSVLQLLRGNASLAAARVCGDAAFSTAALCRARLRLPLAVLRLANDYVLAQASDTSRPRVLLVDVCNHYLPDTPALRRRYRYPGQKKRASCRSDYPQVRLLSVFDLAGGLLIGQYAFASDRHESPMLKHVLRLSRPGDTLVFDRGFVGYANFCLLKRRGVHFVTRLPATLLAAQDGPRRLLDEPHGPRRARVIWQKPQYRPRTHSPRAWAKMAPTLTLRQVRARHDPTHRSAAGLTLISDRTDLCARTIRAWYRRRWEIETCFRHLKRTLRLEFFRGQSVEAIKRELLLRQLAYNLVRRVMLRSARLRRVPVTRVSFADALTCLLVGDAGAVSRLLLNPRRRRTGRPRCLKYRGTNYRLLTHRPQKQRRIA